MSCVDRTCLRIHIGKMGSGAWDEGDGARGRRRLLVGLGALAAAVRAPLKAEAKGDAAPDAHAPARARLVEAIAAQGIRDAEVLRAIGTVPRHELVPEDLRPRAYDNHPLPIGHDQTISQPYIVGLMSQLARVRPGARVLEVGTGSGYQAAVLAEIGAEVYTVEIVPALAARARADLERLGYKSLEYRVGDGYRGWPEAAPFAAIVVTAAPPAVPAPLREQLAVGGRLVLPVGRSAQELLVITRTARGFTETRVAPVRFVPMTGEAQGR